MVAPGLIPVRIEGGLVIWHTPAQFEALWRGVDREAALLLGRPGHEPENAQERSLDIYAE